MVAVLSERQPKEPTKPEQKVEPKFDAKFEFKLNRQRNDNVLYKVLTPEECAALIAASEAPFDTPLPSRPKINYPTLSRQEAECLVREHYEYIEEEKRKRKELDGILRGRPDSKQEPSL